MLALQFQLQQSQWWPEPELRRHQLAQFRHLLAHAAAETSWYAEQADFVQLAAKAEPVSDQQFRQLPRLSRRDLQQHLPRLTARSTPPAHGKRLDLATSGSTGQPLLGYETELNHLFWGACNLRDHLWQNRNLGLKFGAIRTGVDQRQLADWGRAISCAYQTGPATSLNINTPVERQLDWLVAEQPGYLISHASNLAALARCSIDRGEQPTALQQVISFGERLPDQLRDLCQQAWQVPLVDVYSAEEVGYIGLQCPVEPGNYHLMGEQLIVEVLDHQGRPCEPGQWGQVVITTLHNFAMPLIRYEIGDFARVGPPCPCGRGLPVLDKIMGRQRNMITLPDGSQHWPSFPADLWLAVAPINQFQLEQISRQEIIAHYQLERPLSADEGHNLQQRLAQSLRFPGVITLEHHRQPLTVAGSKFEDFISRLEN